MMDEALQRVLEIATGQGIWAVLYIYLFARMLRENADREARYQAIISKLSDEIKTGVDEIGRKLDRWAA